MLLFFFLEKKKAWWYINFAYNMHSPLNSQHCFIGKQMSVWNISSLHTHRHISSKFCFGAECKSKNKTKLKQTKSKNKSKKKPPQTAKYTQIDGLILNQAPLQCEQSLNHQCGGRSWSCIQEMPTCTVGTWQAHWLADLGKSEKVFLPHTHRMYKIHCSR